MKFEEINIGLVIEQKMNELDINKSELARRIRIANQNINRLLERESIDTKKLMSISEALNFNFFDCFRSIEEKEEVHAVNGSVAVGGNGIAHHINVNGVNNQDTIELLRATIADKERTIQIQQQLINELQKRK